MELRVLRSFLAVAREQSISGAARTLHLTQPTLSRQIMELEEEVGALLFRRGNRKITLTEQGMLMRKRAEQMLELEHKTKEEVAAGEEAVSGAIYIGAGESHAFRALAHSIHNLIGQYPDVQFNLYSGNAEDVIERLDKGLLDFGLFIEPYDLTKYDYLRLPAVDTWGVLMRRGCPLAAKDAIEAEDLWNLPLINSRQALKGGLLSSWLRIDTAKLRLVGTYNLLFNAALMVEAGTGYAICLDGIINTTDSDLCFRPLKPVLESNVNLAWNKYQVFSKPSGLLLERVRGYSSK
jgi:DNA-binding transcriptional LysR family regulator